MRYANILNRIVECVACLVFVARGLLATRDLMVAFYANLPKLGKQVALRQAQFGIRRNREHPFFWAAFVLTGNAQ